MKTGLSNSITQIFTEFSMTYAGFMPATHKLKAYLDDPRLFWYNILFVCDPAKISTTTFHMIKHLKHKHDTSTVMRLCNQCIYMLSGNSKKIILTCRHDWLLMNCLHLQAGWRPNWWMGSEQGACFSNYLHSSDYVILAPVSASWLIVDRFRWLVRP